MNSPGKKILLVSNDLPPVPGRVVTGVGLRMHGLIRGLELKGHKVICSIAAKRVYQEEGVPEEFKKNAYTIENLPEIIKRVNPDIVLKEWWGEEDKQFEGLTIPVVFDLPAPRMLEEIYHGQHPETMLVEKIRSLKTGDYFICSTDRHKAYYLPYLIMSGFDTVEDIIGVVHHSITLDENIHTGEVRFVFGGVLWPWQNPLKGLNILIDLLERHQTGDLRIYCGPMPYSDKDKRTYFDFVQHLSQSDRVKISGLLPYSDMRKEYCRATVAFDVMGKNLERELSLSFRTLDYLSCGVPVVTGKYGGWAEWIRAYNAGWVVDPEDSGDIRSTLETIIGNPEIIREYSQNARRLIEENFTYEKVIDPLNRFCRNPQKRHIKTDALTKLLSLEVGRRLRDEGYSKEAVKEFSRSMHDNSESSHFELGMTYMKVKELENAAAAFAAVLVLNPSHWTAQYNICSILHSRGKLEKAKEGFSDILNHDLSPALKGGSCFHIGEICMQEENNSEAARYFRECLKFIPGHRQASHYLETIT